MGTASYPGVNLPGRGVYHPLPSSVEVKERVQLYFYSPSGPSWLVLGNLYSYFKIVINFSLYINIKSHLNIWTVANSNEIRNSATFFQNSQNSSQNM